MSYNEELIKQCRGQYSIQAEINLVAREEGEAKGWGKLIRDKAWREATRQQLRQADGVWCDGKANECHCESGFKPNFRRHAVPGATIGGVK